MQVIERLSLTLVLLWLSASIPLALAARISRGSCRARGVPANSTNSGITVLASTSVSVGASVSIGTTAPPPPPVQKSCYPALDFDRPDQLPDDNSQWWCSEQDEYAFMGFSYVVSGCQSISQLRREFKDIRQRFDGRYVRIYGACDRPGFYDDVIEAAYENTLGVHALIWFGFDGGNVWKARRDTLFNSLRSNPKAPFVVRVVQFGSEPLYDHAISPSNLASQVWQAKAQLAYLNIPVTVSELAYGYKSQGGAQQVLDAIDSINIHMLPFFMADASTGSAAWPLLMSDLQFFIDHGNGKKMYFSENGWPSATSDGVSPNSAAAVASIWSQQQYFQLLDKKCGFFKTAPGGGIGWFAHFYSASQGPGYGIVLEDGSLKFPFHPKTSC